MTLGLDGIRSNHFGAGVGVWAQVDPFVVMTVLVSELCWGMIREVR